jgi:hypothetical protein
MTRHCFVCYCDCGATIYAAAFDDGTDDADTGAMLMHALRESPPVGYLGSEGISLRLCQCMRTTQRQEPARD